MNRARIAWLLRELADEVEGVARPEESAPAVRQEKRERRPVSDLDKARARKSLRRLGVDV